MPHQLRTAPVICVSCSRPTHSPGRGQCPSCRSRERRREPARPDGRREMWTVEAYGAGWYVRWGGQWWQVPAQPHGWTHRRRATAPTGPSCPVTGPRLEHWSEWLGVPV